MPTIFLKLTNKAALMLKQAQGTTSITKAVRDILVNAAEGQNEKIDRFDIKSMRVDGD
jgi:hypothetical protein